MLPSLLPDLLTMLGIIGRVKRIVNAHNDDQRPGEGNQDTVGDQSVRVVRFTPSKWVIAGHDGGNVIAPETKK